MRRQPDQQPPAPLVRDGLVKAEVMVTLNAPLDEGYQGLLWSYDDTGAMVTKSAAGPLLHAVEGGGEPREVDNGAMFIPASMIKCVQIIRGAAG